MLKNKRLLKLIDITNQNRYVCGEFFGRLQGLLVTAIATGVETGRLPENEQGEKLLGGKHIQGKLMTKVVNRKPVVPGIMQNNSVTLNVYYDGR